MALFGLGLGLILVIVQNQSSSDISLITEPLKTRVESFDGHSWQLSKFAGRPMVVNFWGSFCPPCLSELPLLSAMAHKYRDQITFIGLAVGSSAEDVAALVKKFHISYPIAKVPFSTLESWGSETLPATFILSAAGKIVSSNFEELSEVEFDAQLSELVRK